MADGKEAATKEAILVQQRHDQAMLELQVGSSAQNCQSLDMQAVCLRLSMRYCKHDDALLSLMCHVTPQVVTVKLLMSKRSSNNIRMHVCRSA